jgi:large subunit ribosomal protein L1
LIKLVLCAGIGKSAEQIVDNAHEIIQTLIKLKPTAAKGCTSKVSTLQHYESCYCIDPKAV